MLQQRSNIRIGGWLIGLVVLVGIAQGLYQLGALLINELSDAGYGFGDQAIFFGVGRAILNGLLPYADFFENKPPGIFWVTALSLQLTDGALLARLLQCACYVSMPLVLMVSAWRSCDRHRYICISFAAMLGMVLALYTGKYAGTLYTEPFGAAFGLLYAVLLTILPRPYSRIAMLLLGCTMCSSLFFKESFLFSLLAVGLLLLQTTNDFVRGLLVPMAIGGIIGVCLLLLTGIFHVYTQVYLPYMLFEHGAFTAELHSEIAIVPVQWAGFAIAPLLKHLMHEPFLLGAIGIFFVAIVMRIRFLGLGVRLAFALFFLLFSINIGGTMGHQVVTAVPVYGAIALWVFKYTSNRFLPICGIYILVVGFFFGFVPTKSVIASEEDGAVQSIAMTIDTLLDSCQYDRYMTISVADPVYAYTKHSPLPVGPIAERLFPKYSVPLFKKQIQDSLEIAEVILIRNGDVFDRNTGLYLQNYFSENPLECASQFIVPEHLQILFRTREHGTPTV